MNGQTGSGILIKNYYFLILPQGFQIDFYIDRFNIYNSSAISGLTSITNTVVFLVQSVSNWNTKDNKLNKKVENSTVLEGYRVGGTSCWN